MRNAFFALLVLFAMPLIAQDRPRRVSLFVTDPGLGYSEGSGSSGWVAGVGVAFEMHFGPRWSAEISATSESRSADLGFDQVEIDTIPVDLTGRYHLRLPHVRWRPYVGVGARWIKAPTSPVDDLEDRVSPQVIVGLDYNMTPAWSLRIDMKRLLHGEGAAHDPLLKVAIGAGYRF